VVSVQVVRTMHQAVLLSQLASQQAGGHMVSQPPRLFAFRRIELQPDDGTHAAGTGTT
jgi:hypothetical protein